MRRWLLALIVLLWAGPAWAQCVGPAQAAVASAITAAADGATINVCAGSATWTTAPDLGTDKGLTILGAGVGQTLLTMTDKWQWECSAGKPHRASGFTFIGAGSDAVIKITGTCSGFRIDHNRFENVPNGVDAINIDAQVSLAGPLYGLIDNNVFTTTSTNFRAVLMRGSIADGARGAWADATYLGTVDNVFIEDNTFDYATNGDVGSGTTDSNSGASFVFRHNTMRNSAGVTSHGVCNAEGTANQEAYQNSLIAANGSYTAGDRLIHNQGSGEAMYFGNRFTAVGTKATDAISIQHYRAGAASDSGCTASQMYPRCDGNAANAAFDGNWSPTGTYYGYPCHYQPGRKKGNLLSPIYAWDNLWSDTKAAVPIKIRDNWTGPPVASDHIKPNRDYYEYTASFTGATGMGVGTKASLPATCTTNANETGGGVGYWVTDEGEWDSTHAGFDGQLYRCSATNTWTLAYTPYTYPHPLQTTGGPAAVTSPSVVWDGAAVKLQWVHPGTGVTSFEYTLEVGAATNVGLPTPDGQQTYQATFPTLAAGVHTLTVKACNATACTPTTALTIVKL